MLDVLEAQEKHLHIEKICRQHLTKKAKVTSVFSHRRSQYRKPRDFYKESKREMFLVLERSRFKEITILQANLTQN